MASSKVVVASTSTTNTDLPRQTSICSLSTFFADLQNSDQSKSVASMSMDDLLKNIYSDGKTESQAGEQGEEEDDYSSFPVASISRQGSYSLPKDVATKTVDEVWKDIVTGNDQAQQREVLTLEDFLTKAGVAREDEVVRVPVLPGPEGYGVEVAINDQFQVRSRGGPLIGYVNGSERRLIGAGRGKRKVVEEPVDKATQQKQRRMIKNRESAARSRERKQAYTVELETLVTQLEEENARLLREEAEQIKERRKQLKENLIPVVEKRRPPRALRRVRSVHW